MDQTDRYIDGIQHLPPAPIIATELLDLFKNEDHDVDRIVELISYDPSLTVEVLKRCNSAFFRGREQILDMFEAVTRVGFYEIYCVVVSMFASRTMALGEVCAGMDTGHLWRHSVMTAVTAETLARRIGQNEAAAFTAGLLHDVGKLILMSAEPMVYTMIVQEAGTNGLLFLEKEFSHLGVTHAEVGARLLERWKLPANVAAVVLHHHGSPLGAYPFEQVAATVSLANVLVHQFSEITGEKPAPTLASTMLDSMKLLDLTYEQFPDVIQQTYKGLDRVQMLLSMVKSKAEPVAIPAGGPA